MTSYGSVVGTVLGHKKVWLAHFFGNAVLFALIYGWLSIPDRTAANVVSTIVLGLVILLAGLWLHASTLSFFRSAHSDNPVRFLDVLRSIPRRLPGFFLWCVAAALLYWGVLAWDATRLEWANWMASGLTLRLQRPVRPDQVNSVLTGVFWIACGFVIPLIVLPSGSVTAGAGLRGLWSSGLRETWKAIRRPRYWGSMLLFALLGAYVPYLLIWWVPLSGGLGVELASMVLRLGLAYGLAITCLLLIASLVGRQVSRG